MEFSVMQTEVCDELGISYTDIATNKLFSLTKIKRWLNMGKNWALAYKKWPFLEKLGTDAIDATGNYPYPTLIKTKNVFLITVDGKRYVKIAYEDYLKYFEDDEDGDDRVWAEFDRTIYINGNACDVGDTVNMYGTEGVADLSANDDETPFADGEPTGDEAIVLYAVAKGLRVKGKRADAREAKTEAKELLDLIWARIMEAKPREVRKSTPLLKRINVLKGTVGETGQSNVGRF